MKRLAGVLTVLCMSIVAAASAQAGCDKFPHSPGSELSLDSKDKNFAAGLRASFGFGFERRSTLLHDIGAHKQPCSHGDFTAGTSLYQLYGEDSSAPMRWAVSQDNPDTVLVLFGTPKPETGYKLLMQKQGNAGTPVLLNERAMMVALGITVGTEYKIYRYYDAIPSDDLMKQDMSKALTGQLPVLATYDPETQILQLP